MKNCDCFQWKVSDCKENARVNGLSSQIYTRSVIDPIPASASDTSVDSVTKSGDKQKKKAKMSDDEIMEKLRRCLLFLVNKGFRTGGGILSFLCKGCVNTVLYWFCVRWLLKEMRPEVFMIDVLWSTLS